MQDWSLNILCRVLLSLKSQVKKKAGFENEGVIKVTVYYP